MDGESKNQEKFGLMEVSFSEENAPELQTITSPISWNLERVSPSLHAG
jgi:hypothetical protein